MNVLIACEESQRVCVEFRRLGYRAFSCDIIHSSGGHPSWHIKHDVISLLNGHCEFITEDGEIHHIRKEWDLIIAHPPCTYLTVSGNRWFNIDKYGNKARERIIKRNSAYKFFMKIARANCEHIAIENPIGFMNTHYKKPTQIIQPYMFGDNARKSTCLWLKNLPCLVPTNIVNPGEILDGGYSVNAHADGRDNEGKWLKFNDPELAKLRSKTFPGIARAMATQWGNYVNNGLSASV